MTRKAKKPKEIRPLAKVLGHVSLSASRHDFHREFLEVAAGRDGYVHSSDMGEIVQRQDVARSWSVYGKTVSIMLDSGAVVKPMDAFDNKHTETENSFTEFLRECAELRCPRPASYASVFHAQFHSPTILKSYNYPLAPYMTGAWQAHKGAGSYRGRYNKYDLNSAYLWASTLGLPRPASFRTAHHIGKLPGLFLVEYVPKLGLPYPLNIGTNGFGVAGAALVSTEEINAYDLHVTRVIYGVTWSDYIYPDAITSTVARASFGKQMSRAFWGRWCSTVDLECHSKKKSWYMPNRMLNIPWAHLLVSRVKMRCWDVSANAVHVFVDSVITTDTLPTGTKIGDWRLDAEYNEGVKVRRAGFYGPVNGDWDRMSGIQRGRK